MAILFSIAGTLCFISAGFNLYAEYWVLGAVQVIAGVFQFIAAFANIR